MGLHLDGKNRVIGEVQQPRGPRFPPFNAHARNPTSAHGSSRPAPHAQAHKILFIEDDGLIADMYRIKLESEGWNVEVAADGEAGVRQAIGEPPDLILLDMLLPRLDGIEVL